MVSIDLALLYLPASLGSIDLRAALGSPTATASPSARIERAARIVRQWLAAASHCPEFSVADRPRQAPPLPP